MMSDSLEDISETHKQAPQLFMAYDGDNAGRLIGRAVLADNAQALHDASNRIAHGHDIVHEWVKSQGGQVISGGGDEGTFTIPSSAINEIENLRKDYQYATNLTMTVGVGQSLSQAGKALMVGKFRGKDQVCQFDESIEQELAQAQAHITGGNATDEERKLGEAYLKPEGEPMKESEEQHDCQYCAEMAQDNVQDEDHCQYCHDMPGEEGAEQPHCQYCAEAEQRNSHDPNSEGHEADCQYCAAMTQDTHEHTGDDCQYCQEAEQAKPDHEHTGDDCQYCQDASSQSPEQAPDQSMSDNGQPVNEQGLQEIAQEIEATTQPGETPTDVLSNMDGPTNDGPADMPGTQMQDNVSHPDDYQQDAPTDMGMAEGSAPEAGPDLSQVLQGGLENQADQIQREKVIQMVSEALEGFKGCKDILERAKQQAPQLYTSSISMLKAMIEMAKMLGLAPQEAQPEQMMEQPQQESGQRELQWTGSQQNDAAQSVAPAQAPAAPARELQWTGAKPAGKTLG